MSSMGAGRVQRDTDGGEETGGDRPHAVLGQAEHASGHRAGGQGGDSSVGESAVTYPLSWAYLKLNRIRLELIRAWESRDRFRLDCESAVKIVFRHMGEIPKSINL